MPGISGKLKKSLRNTAEQNVIDGSLIPQNKRIEFRRNGEYNMEVWNGKEIFFSLLKPFFFFEELALRAMSVSARVVGYPDTAAAVTFIYMTTEFCCPASFNRTHSADMVERHFIGHSVSLAVLTEDIRNLYTLPSHLRIGAEAMSWVLNLED